MSDEKKGKSKKKFEPMPETKLEAAKMIAKKDFVINHNGFFRAIKAGDDLSDLPELYWVNMKTEGVL